MRRGRFASLLLNLASRWRRAVARATALGMTIRGRILIAFLIMSVITAALGAYATLGIRNAGVLVDKTFDKSLMSINYARAAAADFAAMRAAFARQWIATSPDMRAALDKDIDRLGASLSQDLEIAAERSQSVRATRAAENVQHAVDAWKAICERLRDRTELDVNWDTLDHYAAKVDDQIDLLVNYTAGDGFLYRAERARHGRARRAAQHRRHRAGAVALRAGGLGPGAAHRRAALRSPPTSPSASPPASSTSPFPTAAPTSSARCSPPWG